MINPVYYNCPSCKTVTASVLAEVSLLICKHCNEVILDPGIQENKLKPAVVPQDWSFLQIGSEGEYNQRPFTITGRLRIQLRNDYKNFWCATIDDNKCIWIMESFAAFSILGSAWYTFNKQVEQLHAGSIVKLTKDLQLKGEYVEKCERVCYEGELGSWKLFKPGFFFIQCSSSNDTAVFIALSGNIQYLVGEKVSVEKLNLKNIIFWDEWR